jgi:hypothetical protein
MFFFLGHFVTIAHDMAMEQMFVLQWNTFFFQQCMNVIMNSKPNMLIISSHLI